MKYFLMSFPVFMMLAVCSCSPSNKYKAELEEIDSCLTILDEIETDLNGIEFDSLNLMVAHIMMNEDSIKKYYDPDTLSLEIGKRMNECKGVRKSLKNVNTKRENYFNEVTALRTQFTSLKTDIENGVLEEDKVKKFVEEEKLALNVLNLSFHDFYQVQELQKKYYYSAVPIIDELIAQLRNEAQLEK